VTSPRALALDAIRVTGVLPAIKLRRGVTPEEAVAIAEAVHAGGARALEITTTTPGVLDAFAAIRAALGSHIVLASGTTLDAATAKAVIDAGATALVSPALVPAVIDTARRYGVAMLCGAFTATEVLQAQVAGSDMVKIFPAALGGPSYMTNLRMVYPNVELVPSGGVSVANAAAFIHAGATAVSGARGFYDADAVGRDGLAALQRRVRAFVDAVAAARATMPELP
jgi:2-dehydro-3-deoxyphosphogluconate aldolase / (4S)-4-hydroxy-2-oxoglutarate aldolase